MPTPIAHGMTLDDGTIALLVLSEDPPQSRQIVRLLTDGVERYRLAQIDKVLRQESLSGEGIDDHLVISLATRYGFHDPVDHPHVQAPTPGEERQNVMSAALSALR
jgi:hypothetical protein